MLIKLRTRKRGKKLRAVAGTKFGIGYSNNTSRSVQVHSTFKFK